MRVRSPYNGRWAPQTGKVRNAEQPLCLPDDGTNYKNKKKKKDEEKIHNTAFLLFGEQTVVIDNNNKIEKEK